MHQQTPPGIFEIFFVPLLGVALIELLHTRQNELELFFLPFMTVILRLFMTQSKKPQLAAGADPRRFSWLANGRLAIEQFSTLVLLLVQVTAVMAGSPTVPSAIWLIVFLLFAVYVILRWSARQLWIRATNLGPDDSRPDSYRSQQRTI